ncbi:unnamed protein product, partial [Mesorhabditis spiculigera]
MMDGPAPRLCTLTKEYPGQEYGYNLHAEKGKGQFVGVVDHGSIAEKSGLRTGDRILAVNGHSIIEENHTKVVTRIKSNPNECSLLVLDATAVEWYATRGLPLPTQPRSTTTHHDGMKPRPRLCELQKSSPNDEFGFNLHAEKGRGHFIGTVDPGGIGDRAGLQTGQRIVGVNGELIYPSTQHKDVVTLIKRSPVHTQLLVASEDVDSWYKENREEYSFSYVEDFPAHRSHAPSTVIPPHETITEAEAETVARRMTQEVIASVYEEHPLPLPEAPSVRHDTIDSSRPSIGVVPEPLGDDILDAVFAAIPITTQATVTSTAVDTVPQHAVHVEPVEQHQHVVEEVTYNPPVITPPQTSPLSQNSSGYGHSDSSHNGAYTPYNPAPPTNGHHHQYNDGPPAIGKGALADPFNDIFNLNAKEARERLRNNRRNQRSAVDMSLEEKHRLIMNM